jgi:hypothetical protein
LSKRTIKALDFAAASIDREKTSVHVFAFDDGHYEIEYSSTPFIHCAGEWHYGVNVIHPLDQFHDPRIALKLTAPWEVLEHSSPDTGHIVYAVHLQSPELMGAQLALGGPVVPKQHLVDAARETAEGAFDVATGERIPVYIGKTSQGMAKRLRQHIDSAVRHASTPFHRRIAGDAHYAPMIPSVFVLDTAKTEQRAYDLEEQHIRDSIEQHSEKLYPLNVLTARDAIAKLREEFPELFRRANKEQAEELLALRAKNTSAAWDDPQYAESVICNNERNFDAHSVRQIRMLRRLSTPPVAIAKAFGVPPARITKLLAGKTYNRIC